jgi:autonomous glycyl radical cofactor GrcA
LNLARDVADIIVARGRLTKDEIVETWGLTQEEYAELKARLAKDLRLESLGKGAGGFAARVKRLSVTEEDEELQF